MDVLKILTRSTSLQNKSNKATSIEQLLPLTDFSSNPESGVELGRGVKRKRSDLFSASEGPSAPNFFGEKQPRQYPDDLYLKNNNISTSGIDSIEDEASFQTKSEEECRKVLKCHKLKITLLDQDLGPQEQNEQSKKNLRSAGKAPGKKGSLPQLAVQPLESFKDLRSRFRISRRLSQNLTEHGYTVPTEVQLAAIPVLLGTDEDRGLIALSKTQEARKSHIDLLTIAPTGSGKTLAFMIPVIQGILDFRHQIQREKDKPFKKSYVRAIILAPTHELADQLVNETRRLVAGTAVKVTAMRKDMHIWQSEDTFRNLEEDAASTVVKSDILVSTPLTLQNFISSTPESEPRHLPDIRYLVLDEADVLLDPLFRDQTLSIWDACTSPSLQTTLWSATIASSIESLAQKTILSRRNRLSIHTTTSSSSPTPETQTSHIIRLIAGIKDTALPTISHRLIYAATEQGKLLALRQILHPSPGQERDHSIPSLLPPFLVFTQTILRATALYRELLYDIPVEAGGSARIAVLHSSLSDTARADIMTRFRRGEVWVLITTDLLARGMDFRGVNGVVNYDIPTTSAAYVHRAGRTGRAGRKGGVAITLYTEGDVPYVKNVANVIKASEKARRDVEGEGEGEGDGVLPKWLLDALPDVSKKTRRELKRRGVEVRRAGGGREGKKGEAETRISTKSGVDSRKVIRKVKTTKGKRKKSRKRERVGDASRAEGSGDEWGGFED
ncbi:RNA-dependent ATPase rok1 [Thelotrema lepadinum]|nr:RNA-dependent ATPase rok1 [Thelotrema lepadinum]